MKTKKPRKPGRMKMAHDRIVWCEDEIDWLTIGSWSHENVDITLKDAKRLRDWLTRFIDWQEEK